MESSRLSASTVSSKVSVSVPLSKSTSTKVRTGLVISATKLDTAIADTTKFGTIMFPLVSKIRVSGWLRKVVSIETASEVSLFTSFRSSTVKLTRMVVKSILVLSPPVSVW